MERLLMGSGSLCCPTALGGHGGRRDRAEVCVELNDIKLLKKREKRGVFSAFIFTMVFSTFW